VLQFLLVFGWGLAACNRVGNLLGAGRGADARFAAGVAWLMAASSAGCVGTLVIIMRRHIARLFVDGGSDEAEAVLDVAASLIPITTTYSMLATLAPGWSQQVLFGLGARLRGACRRGGRRAGRPAWRRTSRARRIRAMASTRR